MTIKSAASVLTPPLIFGNPAQIAAVNFLEHVELCCIAYRECQWLGHRASQICIDCFGRGHCRECGHDCDECSGAGTLPGSPCNCLIEFKIDEISAAMASFPLTDTGK